MFLFFNFNGMNRATYCGEYMLNKSFFLIKSRGTVKKFLF